MLPSTVCIRCDCWIYFMCRYLKPVHCRRNRAMKLIKMTQHSRVPNQNTANVWNKNEPNFILIWVLITNKTNSVASIHFFFLFRHHSNDGCSLIKYKQIVSFLFCFYFIYLKSQVSSMNRLRYLIQYQLFRMCFFFSEIQIISCASSSAYRFNYVNQNDSKELEFFSLFYQPIDS